MLFTFTVLLFLFLLLVFTSFHSGITLMDCTQITDMLFAIRITWKSQITAWLRSDVIKVGDVGRLDVTIRSLTKPCKPSASFCKEYFYAYVWESNISVTAQQIHDPIKDFQRYRRFANVTRQSNQTNLTIPLEVTSKYIVMAIRDQGGCRLLYSIKISYKVCVKKTLEDSLVLLPLTISQEELTPVQGSCGKNSRQIVPGNLTVFCDSNGEWNTSRLERRYVCKEDMENRGGSMLRYDLS